MELIIAGGLFIVGIYWIKKGMYEDRKKTIQAYQEGSFEDLQVFMNSVIVKNKIVVTRIPKKKLRQFGSMLMRGHNVVLEDSQQDQRIYIFSK